MKLPKPKIDKLLALSLTLMLFITALAVYLTYLDKRISMFSVDEHHTVNISLERYYGHEHQWLRVGEGGRLFGFFLMPGAQYHMNKNMGASAHVASWWYPGGHYLKKNFVGIDPPQAKKVHARDPNIQDYVNGLRIQQAVLLLSSFILAGLSLYLAFGFSAGLVYTSLSLMSTTLLKEAAYFYTDIHLVIIFNTIIFVFFLPRLEPLRRAIWLVTLFSFGVSTKISMVAMAPMVWMKLIDERLMAQKRNVFEYVLCTCAAAVCLYFLFAITAPSFSSLIDQQISNFWHYETGHRVFESSGWFQLNQIFRHINLGVIVSGLITIAVLVRHRELVDRYIIVLLAIILFLMINLQGLHYFVARNIILLELLLAVVSAIVLSKFISLKLLKYQAVIQLSLVFLCFIYLCNRYEPFDIASFKTDASSCERILNITENIEEALNGDFFDFPEPPFELKKQLPQWQKKVSEYDCVYVHRTGEAKQFSNWILPQTHSLVSRHGSHFLFINK